MNLRKKRWLLRISGMAAGGALVGSCAPGGDSLVIGSMAAAARDQIMLVRSEPPSFGFLRLTTQVGVYPDLGAFISEHGLPDFLAETGSEGHQYFILYYLNERHAFACRTRAGNSRAMEFAGPYPVTDNEFRLLDDFRRNLARSSEKS